MCKALHTCSLRMYSTAAIRKLALSVFSWLGIRSRSAWNLQGNIIIILLFMVKEIQHMLGPRPQHKRLSTVSLSLLLTHQKESVHTCGHRSTTLGATEAEYTWGDFR